MKPWFRMYARFMTDPVIEELSFEDQRHFVFVLCMKCDGLLDKEFPSAEMRERAIARRLGLQGEALTNAKARLMESRLIDADWQPRNWDRLQFASDSDPTAADRKRRQREQERVTRDSHGDVTRDGVVTVTRTDTEQIQNRSEGETRAARATRLPDDFELTPARRLVAEAETLPAERTFAKFCDYWRSVSGAKARKLDWDATWRNWCRSEVDRGMAKPAKERGFVC